MAFADWDVDIGDVTGASWEGGDDGTDVQNAGLSSPLTLQGTDCRLWKPNTADAGVRSARYNIDDGVYPAFSGVPDTQAMSVRAWMRRETQAASKFNAITLHAKGSGVNANGRTNGYTLVFGRDQNGGLLESGGQYNSVSLMFRGTNEGGAFLRILNVVSLSLDAWHHLRMDVIPTKNGGVVDRDTIRVYRNTGSEASPVWTLLHEEVILLTETWASPWGNATHTRMGFGISTASDPTPANRTGCYIDGFEALVKAIP